MQASKDLRKEVISLIQTADDKVVKMVYAMLEVDAQDDWYDNMPETIQADFKAALQESENNLGMSHQEVKEKYGQWFAK